MRFWLKKSGVVAILNVGFWIMLGTGPSARLFTTLHYWAGTFLVAGALATFEAIVSHD